MNVISGVTVKGVAKTVFRRFSTIAVFPFFLAYQLSLVWSDRDSVFSGASQFFSLIPGVFGSYLRTAFYELAMQSCEVDIYIGFGVLFSQRATEIDHGVYIGPQCNIGLCRIDRCVLLGSGVHLLSGKHQHHFSDPVIPVQEQGGVFSKITIGEDSWIGNGAIVMANVGRKCVVGAGAVVTHPVDDFSIVAGNPAVVVGHRS